MARGNARCDFGRWFAGLLAVERRPAKVFMGDGGSLPTGFVGGRRRSDHVVGPRRGSGTSGRIGWAVGSIGRWPFRCTTWWR